MPNIKISDLPDVTLPLDAANVFLEVQAFEAGVEVSRKIAADALSGAFGLDATFVTVTANAILPNERILTAGTNVALVDGGAGNPITINVANQNPFATPLGILGDINTATPPVAEAITADLEFRDLQDVNIIGSIGFDASNTMDFKNLMRGGELLFSATDAGGAESFAYFFDPAANFWLRHGATQEIVITSQPVADGGILVANGVTGAGGNSRVRTASDKGALELEFNFDTSTDTGSDPGSQDFRMNNVNPALVTEIAVADQSVALQGEFDLFWGAELVSGDKLFIVQPNFQSRWAQYELTGPPVDQTGWWNFPVSLISNGTIFQSTELCRFAFTLVSLGAGGGVNSVTGGTNINDSGTAADPILNVDDPLIIGSVNMTSADSAGDTGVPYDNVPINIGANLIGTMPMTQLSRQRIQTKSSSSSFNATLFINIGGSGTGGSDTIIGSLNGAQLEVAFGVAVRMKHGLSGTDIFETIDTGILLPEGSVFIDEKAAAETNTGARGEFWVRNDAPNVPMFTNDLGTDFVLNSAGAAPQQLVDPSANVAFIAQGSGLNAIRRVGNTDAEEARLFWEFADGTVRMSIGQEFAEAIIIRNHISDDSNANIVLRVGVGGGNQDRINCGGAFLTGGVTLHAGGSGGPNFRVENDTFVGSHVDGGSLFISEEAAQQSDVAGNGQLWVRNDVPNVLLFRDDAGNQSVLSTNLDGLGLFLQNFGAGTEIFGISATGAGGIDLDFTNVSVVNFNNGDIYDFSNELIRSVSTFQMQERAAANGDIAGQGQIWIENLIPNTLMYTDDTGIDFRVSCVQWFNNYGGQQQVNNTTTPVNITQLSGFRLDANSVYHIEIFLKVNQASATPDLLLRLNRQGAGTFSDEFFQITSIAQTGVFTFQDNNVHTALGAIQNAVGNHTVHIIGTVDVGAGDTWDLQFAQQIATVANTIIDDSSYVKITKIGPGP